MNEQTPTQADTLRELDEQLAPSDPLAPRHRQPPSGRKLDGSGLGLLADDGGFSESSFQPVSPPSRGRSKPRTTSSSSPRTARETAATVPPDDEIIDVTSDLGSLLLGVGAVTSMILPVTGTTIVLRAEMASQAVMAVAKTNPKLYARVKKIVAVAKYEELGRAATSITVALAVDLHVMKPESTMPQLLIPDVIDKFRVPTEMPPADMNGHTSAEAPAYSHVGDTDE